MLISRSVAVVFLFLAHLAAASDASAQAPAKSKIQDIVQLKDGQSSNGEVKVAEFTLKTRYGTLTIPKKDILAIEYRKPPNKLEDEVQISAGTRLRGDLLPAVIKVNADGLGDLDIPKTDILAIMIQRPIEDVTDATRKALGRRKP